MHSWLHVDGILQTLLLLLERQDIDTLMSSLYGCAETAYVFHDADVWAQLLQVHFGGEFPRDLEHLALPMKERSWPWEEEQHACTALRLFLRCSDELDQFMEHIVIVEGSIGRIQEIEGKPVDALAFPTNSYLANHHIGAAAAIFQRAGKGLADYVMSPHGRQRHPVGDVVVTPAFDARVRALLHCVGPRASMPHCYRILRTTYENVVSAVLREDLQCVAMASVSTGAMGLQPRKAASVALGVLQRFIRSNYWEGTFGIVCYDTHVYEAFCDAKADRVRAFNVEFPVPEDDYT